MASASEDSSIAIVWASRCSSNFHSNAERATVKKKSNVKTGGGGQAHRPKRPRPFLHILSRDAPTHHVAWLSRRRQPRRVLARAEISRKPKISA